MIFWISYNLDLSDLCLTVSLHDPTGSLSDQKGLDAQDLTDKNCIVWFSFRVRFFWTQIHLYGAAIQFIPASH